MNDRLPARLRELLDAPPEDVRLAEVALLLSEAQRPGLDVEEQLGRLDDIARAVSDRLPPDADAVQTVLAINQHIFHEMGFSGAGAEYYDPRNSFLDEVLTSKRGIPITLAILYIEMPGGSGLQLAAQLPTRCRCVFSTAYGEHALQDFELGAIDYLLKPYTAERLAATLERVRVQLALPVPAPHLQAGEGETWVDTRDGRQRIRLAEVQWLAAADNYVALHLPPLSFLERSSLSALLERPAWSGLFLRVHRSHAVNPAHVMRVMPCKDGEALLTMSAGQQLRVSRGYRAVLASLKRP